jgi:CheY-like chemotaxis protein
MKSKAKRPKISLLHDEIPAHLQEYMQLTRLAEMGRMAASVAHEINNPLMIAQGFAENIEMLLARPNPPMEDMRLQILEIVKACQRMSRIINKMNRLSRNQKLRLHVVDLAEVALNAVDFLKVQAADLDVQMEFDFSSPMPIKCDVVQVEQMVLNILANAFTALQQVNEQRRVRISFEEVGRKWQQVKIWNNGPIIPEAMQAQIMSPFFSTKPDTEHTGLGLAVSRAIMDVHGGDLSFYSKEGLGTEFILSFPRPKENPWKERERSARGPVFVLDRQANYRRTLQEKFKLLGFKTEAFSDYDEGYKKLQTCEQPGGVLVDIVPGQSEGISFIRKLRQELGPQGLIFTMSHFPSARDLKSDLKAAGATECFEKPIHADNFTLVLKLLDAPILAARDKRAA